jgi:hypothetical protein
MRSLYRNLLAAGMFAVRMLALALMVILQLTVGGADVRPPQRNVASQ